MLWKLIFSLVVAVHSIYAVQPASDTSCSGSAAGATGVCKSHFAEEAVWPDEFWPSVGNINYEGPSSNNPLAYRYYNADEVILGKRMKEWLRFSVAFWHTLRGQGADPFGAATKLWPWEQGTDDAMVLAFRRVHAVFELMEKLGITFWAFHDRDIAPEGKTLKETNENLDAVVEVAMELQKGTDIRPLWATANLFHHPRYKDGAATSANATIFAHAAAQVKKAMDVAQRLQAENFVFWGGREGYSSLLTTNLKLEIQNYARFLHMAANYSRQIGFGGQLMLEPKPQEPTKHQYDWDVATTLHFLTAHNLSQHFKLNIECNHATLAGHSCEHELRYASMYDALGSIDANTGDPQVGWDTDQFLTDPREATLLMSAVIDNKGLSPGGINFDAKLRRESTDPVDVFYGLISGMDALARGLRNAAALKEAGLLEALKANRYSSWGDGCHTLGGAIQVGKVGFQELEMHALHHEDDIGKEPPSQHIELAEIYLDMAIG